VNAQPFVSRVGGSRLDPLSADNYSLDRSRLTTVSRLTERIIKAGVTGGEIVVGKAAVDAANQALGESRKTKAQLIEIAKDSPALQAAAESLARRVAVKQANTSETI